ncbi:hypothetical protein JXB02_01620 [Candidatus Woesearchaeota archaeon]|nr:hypothetical protein [Candidatus Woesearchaeota archaeon]
MANGTAALEQEISQTPILSSLINAVRAAPGYLDRMKTLLVTVFVAKKADDAAQTIPNPEYPFLNMHAPVNPFGIPMGDYGPPTDAVPAKRFQGQKMPHEHPLPTSDPQEMFELTLDQVYSPAYYRRIAAIRLNEPREPLRRGTEN